MTPSPPHEKRKREGLPQGLRFDVFRRDNFTCRYCGRSSPEVVLHCDHVKPRSKGGDNELDNLVTACTDCNFGKRAKENVTVPSPVSALGFIGLYGYTFEGEGDDLILQYQFKIIRADGEFYAVQLFSWWAGDASEVKIWPREFVLSDRCKLYATAGDWRDAYDHKWKLLQDRQWAQMEQEITNSAIN